MPRRLQLLQSDAEALARDIQDRENYINMVELENLRLRLKLKIIVGGAQGLIIWSISLIVAGLIVGVSPTA